jgi:hypothetical protein
MLGLGLPARITVGTSPYDMHPRQMRETFSRVVIGDKENATLVAEGIFSCEYCSPFDAANRQTLRYANRGGGIFAKEELAISHQPHSLNLWNACQCLASLKDRSGPMKYYVTHDIRSLMLRWNLCCLTVNRLPIYRRSCFDCAT